MNPYSLENLERAYDLGKRISIEYKDSHEADDDFSAAEDRENGNRTKFYHDAIVYENIETGESDIILRGAIKKIHIYNDDEAEFSRDFSEDREDDAQENEYERGDVLDDLVSNTHRKSIFE